MFNRLLILIKYFNNISVGCYKKCSRFEAFFTLRTLEHQSRYVYGVIKDLKWKKYFKKKIKRCGSNTFLVGEKTICIKPVSCGYDESTTSKLKFA